jgi:hypothetical protein
MTKLRKLYNYIKRLISKKVIFRKEYEILAFQQQLLDVTLQEALKREKELKNTTLADATREQLKGFNVKLLDSDMDIEGQYADIDSRFAFLSECHDLYKNKARIAIENYLKRNQIQFSVKEAVDLEQINFGRATINGITLFDEEVERLNTIYLTEHTPKEQFDDKEIV